LNLKSFSILAILFASTAFLVGCGSSSGPSTGGGAPTGLDIYVAGAVKNASNVDVAEYWKNGTAVPLTDGTTDAAALSIAISGSDVYVAGHVEDSQQTQIPVYWQNGTEIALPISTTLPAGATGIAVSGGNVYVVGFAPASCSVGNCAGATLWTNGVATALTDGSFPGAPSDFYSTSATGIFVDGPDVYVSGFSSQCVDTACSSVVAIPVYWKNGVVVELTSAANQPPVEAADSIFVSGSDVYVAGFMYNTPVTESSAVYWKNGVQVVLDSAPSHANAIFANATDVFIAGDFSNSGFGYWDNGNEKVIGQAQSSVGGGANAFAISGTDIYVGGQDSEGNAAYWLNGAETNLGPGFIESIALVPAQ
jgi:hypothetical protein